MTDHRFDLLSLRLFVTVVEAGSLTAGARIFSLSLPAVSKRISELEALVGVQLLVRSKGGVAATAPGKTLYQHAVQVGAEVAQLSVAMSDYRRNIVSHVRVCANTSAVTGFLPGFLSDYLRVCPDVKIDLEEVNSEPLVRAVETGAADVGIFASNVAGGELQTAVCDVDRLVLVAPRAHALARREKVSWAEALEYDFVGLNRGSALMRQMDAATSRLTGSLKLRVQVKSFDAVCQMVAMGLGLGLLPLASARVPSRALPVTLIPLDEEWARNRVLLVGWREAVPLSPHARLIIDMLRKRGEDPKLTQAAARNAGRQKRAAGV